MRNIIGLTLLILALAAGTVRPQEVTGNLEGRVMDNQTSFPGFIERFIAASEPAV